MKQFDAWLIPLFHWPIPLYDNGRSFNNIYLLPPFDNDVPRLTIPISRKTHAFRRFSTAEPGFPGLRDEPGFQSCQSFHPNNHGSNGVRSIIILPWTSPSVSCGSDSCNNFSCMSIGCNTIIYNSIILWVSGGCVVPRASGHTAVSVKEFRLAGPPVEFDGAAAGEERPRLSRAVEAHTDGDGVKFRP